MREKVSAEDRVREIRRKTRKKYSSEEKVRIVLEVLEIILEIKIGRVEEERFEGEWDCHFMKSWHSRIRIL